MSTKGSKRVLQACVNCRRKKTRCPGERPNCSTCIRLRQICRYSHHSADSYQTNGDQNTQHLEHRLAQVEKQLAVIVERSSASPRQGEPPQSFVDCEDNMARLPLSASCPKSCQDEISLPSKAVLTDAIDLYFSTCHRQPIWLFENKHAVQQSCCSEEIVLSILALATQYSAREHTLDLLAAPNAYADAARKKIMLSVAEGCVMLSTMQALCILAFANFVGKDVNLARLHTSLIKALFETLLSATSSVAQTPILEDYRRLYWSVFLLDNLIGIPARLPTTIIDIKDLHHMEAPRYATNTSSQCLNLPHELHGGHECQGPGVWAHMVQMVNVWSATRSFVQNCANGRNKHPWAPESEYTWICASLLDIECFLPSFIRLHEVKFMERSTDEIKSKEEHWLNWVHIQVTYHAIHSVLNHPFLYSQKALNHRSGPNMFWRSSSEAAALHSTWIVRMIDMALEKRLPLSDPFFAHVAAIAATLHFHFNHATDSKVRSGAIANLNKCKAFIGNMAKQWPVCQSIQKQLDDLLSLAGSNPHPESGQPNSIAMNTALMWKILDFAAPKEEGPLGRSVFHPSVHGALSRDCHHQTEISAPIQLLEPAGAQGSNDLRSSSPEWFASAHETQVGVLLNAGQQAESQHPTITLNQSSAEQVPASIDPSSLEGPDSQTLMDITFDSLPLVYDSNDPYSNWWDSGIL